MINIHLNGDIVRCPDMRAIHLRAQEIRDSHRICKYGYHEDTCDAWQSSLINFQNVKKFNNCGRCPLAASNLCPGHKLRTERGKKEKSFQIDNQVYRKIASAAHYMVKESDNKVLFITLTFPRFKKKHKLTKEIFENEILNSYFSKFVENLRKNYNCGGYVAVRERGEDGNRIHYHLLISIPFIKWSVLNDSWCHTIKNICYHSRNAVTSDKKTLFIKNPGKALRYVCKYFSKARGSASRSRVVFISNNILQKPKQMRQSSEYGFLDAYKFDYMRETSDYTTIFRITDNKEFERFCDTFLYPFFEMSFKPGPELYSFPINSP